MLWSASCWSFQHGQQCQLCLVFSSVPVVWSLCWIRNVNRGTPAHVLNLYILHLYITPVDIKLDWCSAPDYIVSGFYCLMCFFFFKYCSLISALESLKVVCMRSDEGLSMMNQGGEGRVPLGVEPSWLPVCLQFSWKTSEGENPV